MKELNRQNNNSQETKNLQEESDHVPKNVVTKVTEEVNLKISFLQEKIVTIEKERDDLKEDRDALQTKFSALTSKLHGRVECPVCLEVPTSGPVHCCPNGHLVCSKCKGFNCPTCRSRMFSGKSLLAVTVIENIDHSCRYEDCGELLPLAEYQVHLKACRHRVVSCPAPKELCGKDMSLSKVYDHLLSECEGSVNKKQNSSWNNGKFPQTFTIRTNKEGIPLKDGTISGLALDWNGVKFYFNCEKSFNCNVFSVQLLGNADECKDYEVTITVHKNDDKERKGNVQRLVWEPLPVDIVEDVRKKNGLIVGHMMLKKILLKDGDLWNFAVTLDFNK